MEKIIVKIDACGSKEHVSKSKEENQAREKLLQQITNIAKENYPKTEKIYPDGTIYSAQGDCLNLILDRPNVALRSTVNFMKAWYAHLGTYPDCRAIITKADVVENNSIGKMELLSRGFEEISKIEKHADAGEILITDPIRHVAEKGTFTYTGPIPHRISSSHTINSYKVNYLNPRTASDSSLVHALFIANPVSDAVRVRTYEVVTIEFLLNNTGKQSVDILIEYLKSKDFPQIDKKTLLEILGSSEYIQSVNTEISLRSGIEDKLRGFRDVYNTERKETTESIAEELGKALGLDSEYIQENISLDKLIEEYISAVFLEIRMMANFYRLEEKFFEQLAINKSYDHIFHRHFQKLNLKDEEIDEFKRIFLTVLNRHSIEENKYFAAIFHNVLLVYYMNRNDKYIVEQIDNLRNKYILLDTNVLYALQCKASEYNSFISHAVSKLKSIGVTINVFDRSVYEYNESLLSADHQYKKHGEIAFRFDGYNPWIWNEFKTNRDAYMNDFSYCIQLHTIPKNLGKTILIDTDNPPDELNEINLNVVKLEPFYEKEDLGDYYSKTAEAKRKWFDSEHTVYWLENSQEYEEKVLHDANCIKHLECVGDTPYETSNIFITCDFRFAKIRKMFDPHINYITTIKEFQEFMMPYLLLDVTETDTKIATPNLLLASAIGSELAHTKELETVVGGFLRHEHKSASEFEILRRVKSKKRFENIEEKCSFEKLNTENSNDFINDASAFADDYQSTLRENLSRSFAQKSIERIMKENAELKAQLKEKNRVVDVVEKKQRGREKYQRAQKRRVP